jgi:hypothetical protein
MLPITQTGALATWDANSKLSVYGGWTCGREDEQNLTFDSSDSNAALFGFNYKLGHKVHLGYGVLMGQNKLGVTDNDYFVQSFKIGFQPNRCWDYTFEWVVSNDNYDAPGNVTHNAMYGINQELIYKLNRCWAFGLRGEWAHATTAYADANSYELTLGANWTPNKWLIVRPEIRYDHVDEPVFKMSTKKDQIGAGFSTIVKF